MRKAKPARNTKKAKKRKTSRWSKMAVIEREAMKIPFVRSLSAKDPQLGRTLTYYYALGTRSVH
jgi:hypothetical protein